MHTNVYNFFNKKLKYLGIGESGYEEEFETA